MRKLLSILALIIIYINGISQNITQRASANVTVQDGRLMAQYNFFLPRYLDTTAANLQKGIDSCGALIYTYDGNKIWKRACSPKRWFEIAGGGGGTITTITIVNDSTWVVCDSDGNCDTVHINNPSGLIGWQKTLDNSPFLNKYNTIQGAGFPFKWDNLSSMRWNLSSLDSSKFYYGWNGTDRLTLEYNNPSVQFKTATNSPLYLIAGMQAAEGIILSASPTGGNIRIAEDALGNRPLLKFYNSGAQNQGTIGLDVNELFIKTNYDSSSITLHSTGSASVIIDSSRLAEGYGADVASANNLQLGYDGNSFNVTGSTQINGIKTFAWQTGSVVRLVFLGSPTVKNNTTPGAGASPLQLSGDQDFTASSGDVLELLYDGNDWHETGRSLSALPPIQRFGVEDNTFTANRRVNGKGFRFRWDSLSNFYVFDYDGEFVISNNSTFSGIRHYIQADQFSTSLNSYNSASDAVFFTGIDDGKAYADFNAAVGNQTLRWQLWGDSIRLRFNNNGPNYDLIKTFKRKLTINGDSLFVSNPVFGGTSADSVQVITSTGQIKFRNASSFGTTYTFSNGLTESPAGTVKLGGTLTGNTTIATGSFSLAVNTSTSGINPLTASATTGNAVTGTSVDGNGVIATSTNSSAINANGFIGGTFNSSGNSGITINANSGAVALKSLSSSNGANIYAQSTYASTNTTETILELVRSSSGTSANNIGSKILYEIQADDGNYYTSTELISKLPTAAVATRTSQFIITGVDSATTQNLLVLDGDGQATLSQYTGSNFNTAQAKVAMVGTDGKVYAVDTTGLFGGGAGASGITIGTTTITSGTDTRILYNNAGVVGEYTLTGTGTVVAMQTAPTFLTSITTPLIYGGSAANDDIIIHGTSNGTRTTSYVLLQPTAGNVGIGTSSPGMKLDVAGGSIRTDSYLYAGGTATTTYSNYVGVIIKGVTDHALLDFWDAGTRIGEFYTDASSFNFFTDAGKSLNFYTNNSFTNPLIFGSGAAPRVGINNGSPTAQLHIAAGTATANTAPLKFTSGTLNTTAEAATQEYNNSFYQTKNSTLRYALGGVIADFYTDANNSGTGETDAYSYTTPANTLASDGEKISFSYTVNLSDVTATATIKVVFAGNNIANTGALTVSATGAVIVQGWIVRTSSTTARASVNISSPTASTAVYTAQTDITSLTLSGANVLKLTLTAGGAGGGSNDLTAKQGTVSWSGVSAN